MKKTFPASELIINADGSVFHLHVRPEQLADKVIICGDPGRVNTIASHFDSQECNIESREFHTITGTYKGKRISVISTGIGCDNCDIVINEIDALKNIDFETRTEKEQLTSLEIVRIGTCGGLQPFTPVGTFIITEKSIGFDGLLNFYAGRDSVCDLEFEKAFTEHMDWNHRLLPAPYVIDNSKELIDRIYDPSKGMVKGVTIACGGFFGPQGRQLRIPLADPQQNEKVESFEYNGYRITNFEMESSAIAGLSALLGHRAMTVCMVIANRRTLQANTGYKNQIDDLIRIVLDKI
jgi:uridine phosphorylase